MNKRITDKELNMLINLYNPNDDPQSYVIYWAAVELKTLREKGRPEKPIYEADGYDTEGNLVYDTWICPTCETHYEVESDHYKHCPECGQAIDWSEGE